MQSFRNTTAQITTGQTVSGNGPVWIAVPGWSQFDWLWHGFSTRKGGVSQAYRPSGSEGNPGELNLGFTVADPPEAVRENRLRFVEAVTGSRDTPLATVRQVHSCRSEVAGQLSTGAGIAAVQQAASIPEADGLMTSQSGLLLGIQTADCIPVLVADPVRRAVAAFHAGWRGTVQRIVELGLAKMAAEFGSDPGNMIAAIGPGIGPCCYTVGEEVHGKFKENFLYAGELFREEVELGINSSGPVLRLDLIEANRRQLVDSGLKASSITVVSGCTGCQPEFFFSHRTSGGHAGRMMSVIGIRPE